MCVCACACAVRQVLLLSADDGSLVNRVTLDHSPAVMFVTSGNDGTNDIIWAESGALFDSQQSTGTSLQCVPAASLVFISTVCYVRVVCTGAAFIWSLNSHELSHAEIPVSSSQSSCPFLLFTLYYLSSFIIY